MRLAYFISVATLALCGCASKHTHRTSAVSDAKLDGYFERYCDYTGGLGIGFVASQTYDFEFLRRARTLLSPSPENAEPCAPPNSGPATPVDNSGATEVPPSVS